MEEERNMERENNIRDNQIRRIDLIMRNNNDEKGADELDSTTYLYNQCRGNSPLRRRVTRTPQHTNSLFCP